MKRIFLFLAIIMSMQSFAQSDFDTSIDKENGALVYQGQFSFDDLSKESSFTWFRSDADNYSPDAGAVAKLATKLKDYQLVVLLGTWCEDSQNLIPKLYKTLQASGYPVASVRMYGVNRAKEAKHDEHKTYNVHLVPTVIIYKDEKEIGRIVETVQQSIEKDLATIIGAK